MDGGSGRSAGGPVREGGMEEGREGEGDEGYIWRGRRS